MNRVFDVIVAGELNADLILTGDVTPAFGQVEKFVDGANVVLGSSAAIFACAYAALGGRISFLGLAGEDPYGDFMVQGMQEFDIGP